MKSLQDLAAIRDKMKQTVNTREAAHDSVRVVVGMATCGIAAGARPVLNTLTEEVASANLDDVLVTQTGCIGICQYEPVVEVYRPNEEKVTYVKMNPAKAKRVVAEHLINGKPVTEYTIGAVTKETN
ncbi:(2Fe-2S) ferredoxin domain-containing protein [Ruminococcaceae bacterium OttesenSCG-928-A16]|nr:(2Fe-2S) ferredoxin domain-containing protein [Ruminococcaceae bacterium OttesenSCG-928-A16]